MQGRESCARRRSGSHVLVLCGRRRTPLSMPPAWPLRPPRPARPPLVQPCPVVAAALGAPHFGRCGQRCSHPHSRAPSSARGRGRRRCPAYPGPAPGAPNGVRVSTLASRCFALVFMVFVPLVIIVFERSQANVVAYALCLANIIVMVVWLSSDSGAATSSTTKSFLRLSKDKDDGSTGEVLAPIAGMRQDQRE